MKRRNLIGLLAATASGVFLSSPMVKANSKKKELMNDSKDKSFSPNIIYASQTGAALDSNVISGGGTDDTSVIQALLDKAPEMGNLHLVMDGASLIRGLQIHSNTTIECLNSSCGFFLAPQSNRTVIQNANPHVSGDRMDKNITLIGGTYNHNCRGQAHHVTENGSERWVIGMEFYGIENFTMRNVTIRDQRTFAMLVGNWFRVNMENISIDLPGHMDGENQDGIHFWGPGQFLTMRNIQGSSGDDFIALAPDENDKVSDITDVLIDGVFLNNADQGIRLLTRDKGRLDRVIIKNVTGTYRCFGFYIDPWFKGDKGNFGNIVFDTINLSQSEPNYTYTTPFLFRLGGEIESLTLKNIYHNNPADNRSIVDVGWPTPDKYHDSSNTYIKSLLIDGLHVVESNEPSNASFIKVLARVDHLIVRNSEILNYSGMPSGDCLIETRDEADIRTLMISGICVNGIRNLLLHNGKKINTVYLNNIFGTEVKKAFLEIGEGDIEKVHTCETYGAKTSICSGSGKVRSQEG